MSKDNQDQAWPEERRAIVEAVRSGQVSVPEAVQDQVLADNDSAFAESVPIALELRRLASG